MSSRGATDVKRMNTHGNEAGASLLEVMAVAMIISHEKPHVPVPDVLVSLFFYQDIWAWYMGFLVAVP